MSKSFSLIKFQIGPVQDFIAAARSTRDLWSGSYLLSYLVSVGIESILAENPRGLIFPKTEGQPMLDKDMEGSDPRKLIPNLPNLFVARVPSESAMEAAQKVWAAIQAEWLDVAESVWAKVPAALSFPEDKRPELKERFDAQVSRQLVISWQVTAERDDYAGAYRDNGWHLDAVRQTRSFNAWGKGIWKIGAEKDSLTGKEEALCGGPGFAERMAKKGGEIPSLFKHDDHIGAITLIKRTWHVAHLGIRTRDFSIRSIPEIAARKKGTDHAEEEEAGYIAAIAFDGDSIGKWVEGLELPTEIDLRTHHRDFSAALSDFALAKVRAIVEEVAEEGQSAGIPLGQLVYAGGDDVVALVPADAALKCAEALRNAFRESTAKIVDKNGKSPDASAGIAIAHVKSPLQDLIRAAQLAEKRAKITVGRPAFSVALMKRSGEISHWGSKWETGGIKLSEKIGGLMKDGDLSAKFPHRVCQLIEPYLTARTGLSQQDDRDGFDAQAVILEEFAFAIRRQSNASANRSDLSDLEEMVQAYLGNIAKEYEEMNRQAAKSNDSVLKTTLSQTLLNSIVGLCVTTGFMHRQQSGKQEYPNNQPELSVIH